MSNRKLLIRGGDALLFVVCIAASSLIILSNIHEFNFLLMFLPLVFGLCYVFILAPLRIRTGSKTVVWFAVTEFIRLVFVPCYEALNEYVGFYGFSTRDISLLSRSVLLMSYECVFISIFLLIALRNAIKETDAEGIKVQPLGNDAITLGLVLVFGFIIYFTVPEVKRSLNFLLLKPDSAKIGEVISETRTTLSTVLITFTYYAFLCGFIIALDYAKRRYDISGKKLYVFIGVIAGLFTVSIINGESRSLVIYSLYAILQCLSISFRKYRKIIVRILTIGAIVVLLGMTFYRLFTVYKQSSYSSALQGTSLRENYVPSFIEMYCLGPQSVACGIHFSDINQGNFTADTFFYDIFRPFMGLNIIAKKISGSTSIMMYNSWFYGIEGRDYGIFLQIANQGYCYFGLFLAPVFACIFLRIAIYIEKKLKQKKTLFLVFFYNFTYIRLATCVIAGTMSGYITSITMALLMCGTIYVFQKLFTSTVRQKAQHEGLEFYSNS